jgi:membrane protein YdbS with pleckstrin-like domain
MGYIEESLGRGELVLFKARFHWINFALAWAGLALILGCAAWILFAGVESWLVYSVLGGCATALILLVLSMLPFWTTEIGVTNHRLIVKRGWLSRYTDEVQSRSLEQVNFRQGPLGMLFGFGQVDVHGTGVDNLIIPTIADPVSFVKAIDDAKVSSNMAALSGESESNS